MKRSNKKLTTKEFVEKSKKVHGDKFDYSKFIYTNIKAKGIIICPIHGEFSQIPNTHISQKQGCPKCKYEKISNSLKSNLNEFIEKSNKIHNNKYDYSKSHYITNRTKIKIICPIHGMFIQKANGHLNGKGCVKCSHNISKPEIEFLNYLNIPDTKENRQVKISNKKVDGYDKKTNIIYEFLGDYFHGNPTKHKSNNINKCVKKSFDELYKETFKRFDKLKKLGYIVRYIWENDWNKFKKQIVKEPNIVTY